MIPVIAQYTGKGGGTALVIELGEKWNLLYYYGLRGTNDGELFRSSRTAAH